MPNERAQKIYEQVDIIKKAEAELERLMGEAPRRGRPPKDQQQTEEAPA